MLVLSLNCRSRALVAGALTPFKLSHRHHCLPIHCILTLLQIGYRLLNLLVSDAVNVLLYGSSCLPCSYNVLSLCLNLYRAICCSWDLCWRLTFGWNREWHWLVIEPLMATCIKACSMSFFKVVRREVFNLLMQDAPLLGQALLTSNERNTSASFKRHRQRC